MARRKEPGLFDMLMEMPWWVGVIVAAIAYVLIAAVVPRMLADNAILKSFVGICPTAAKMVALLCLVAAGVSAIKSWSRGRLLDGQKGIESIRALSWREFEHLVGEA